MRSGLAWWEVLTKRYPLQARARNFKIKKKPAVANCSPQVWRKRWDSNPRAREGYLISSFARHCANGENTGGIRPFCPQIFAHFLRVLWMKDARKAVSTRQHRVSRILAEKRRVFEKNARTKAR